MTTLLRRDPGAVAVLVAGVVSIGAGSTAPAAASAPDAPIGAWGQAIETSADAPADDERTLRAMLELGRTQAAAGDVSDAEATFRRILAGNVAGAPLDVGVRSEALAGLALTYHRARRHEMAVVVFPQAIELGRRYRGLFNLEQVDLLDAYADSLTNLGRLEEARASLEYAVKATERTTGAGATRVAERLVLLGEWYVEAGFPVEAREPLRRAIRIVEEHEGKATIALVRPLTALADTYSGTARRPAAATRGSDAQYDPLRERGSGGQVAGLPYDKFRGPWANTLQELRLRRRAAAVASGRPDTPPDVAAAAHLGVGDWYQIRNRPADAVEHYRQAWRACATGEAAPRPSCMDWFESPVLLAYVPPESLVRMAGESTGATVVQRVEVQLIVTSRGRASEVSRVLGNAPERRVRETVDAARSARYRPRMVDGEPVDTSGVRFSQVFRVSAPEGGES